MAFIGSLSQTESRPPLLNSSSTLWPQLPILLAPVCPQLWPRDCFKIITSLKTCLDSLFPNNALPWHLSPSQRGLTSLYPISFSYHPWLWPHRVIVPISCTEFCQTYRLLFVSPLLPSPYHVPGQFMFIKPNLLYLLQEAFPDNPRLFPLLAPDKVRLLNINHRNSLVIATFLLTSLGSAMGWLD